MSDAASALWAELNRVSAERDAAREALREAQTLLWDEITSGHTPQRVHEAHRVLAEALRVTEQPPSEPRPGDVRCEAITGVCEWPRCDCDCNCFVPVMDGAGQHSPGCRTVKRAGGVSSEDAP